MARRSIIILLFNIYSYNVAYSFTINPFIKLRNTNIAMNNLPYGNMLNIHNAFLQNITKISYEKMVETNKTITKIYILYNYDLLIRNENNDLYLYNNVNRTNIFYDFQCNLSFISIKYLYLIITNQFKF